ncbi:MAG: 7TM diverse intracellular signaling domain-containing protein [Spirochaetia bacterium]
MKRFVPILLQGLCALALISPFSALGAQERDPGVVVLGNSPVRHRLSDENLRFSPELALPGERAFRFSVRNESHDSDFIFSVFTDDDSYVTLYELNGQGRREIAVLSRLIPRDLRPMRDLRLSTPLSVPAGAGREYLVAITGAPSPPGVSVGMEKPNFDLWPRELFDDWRATQRLLYGLYYGGILLMGIYNLFLFFSLRDWSYLWYSLIILVFSLALALWDGVAGLYLLPGWASISTPFTFGLLDDLTIIFAYSFTRNFLGLKKTAPRLDRAIFLMTLVQAIFFPVQVIARLPSFLAIISVTLFILFGFMVSAIVVSLKQGFRPARYFAIGVAGPLVVVFLVASAYFRLAANIPLSMVGFYFSFAAMALLFSLALGDRISFLSTERERANRLNLAMTDFFVNISHEIRTPLTLISNYLDEYARTVEPSESLKVIRKSVDKLVRDVTQFFDVQRLSRGIEVYGGGPADLSEIVRSRTLLLEPTARRAGIGITIVVEDNLVVHAAPAAVERVLDNLADNGIKYNRPGGGLRIEARRAAGVAELVVSDTGIGIAPVEQEKVFLPYYRVSQPKLNAQGIGMGLALVKSTVASLGGSISIDSVPDKGTSLVVRFPLETLKAAAGPVWRRRTAPVETVSAQRIDATPVLPEAAREIDGPAILVVEDDPDLRSLLCSRISETFPVRAAANGIEAMSCLEGMGDCRGIVSDLMMDGMDGNELFRRVRADTRFARAPFIFITAMSDPQERLLRLADGAADYVVKPFLIDELALKLYNLIRRSEEEKRLRELDRTRAFEAFLGGLAHAIRNPLSAVTGPVTNLRKLLEGRGFGQDDRIVTYLRYAEEGAARIERTLVDAELVLSRPELKRSPLDVLLLAHALGRSSVPSGVDVIVRVEPGTKVLGDARAAQRVLENLVSSAAAALGEKGQVEVAARPAHATASRPATEITVSYAGPSPEAVTIDRMFEPFFASQPGQSAIGLYAAKELAMSMGWELAAASTTDGRAGFKIRAPSC